MKRALNNKEKMNLKIIKEKGYSPEVKETLDWRGRPSYYAEVIELKCWISLGNPGNLSDLPIRNLK